MDEIERMFRKNLETLEFDNDTSRTMLECLPYLMEFERMLVCQYFTALLTLIHNGKIGAKLTQNSIDDMLENLNLLAIATKLHTDSIKYNTSTDAADSTHH